MQLALSKKDKTVLWALVAMFTILGSAWVGERYQPFGVSGRVADYAAKQLDAKSAQYIAAADKKSAPAPKPRPKPVGGTYIVQKGDTLYSISKLHGKKPIELAWANQIGSDNVIYPGQRLRIP